MKQNKIVWILACILVCLFAACIDGCKEKKADSEKPTNFEAEDYSYDQSESEFLDESEKNAEDSEMEGYTDLNSESWGEEDTEESQEPMEE